MSARDEEPPPSAAELFSAGRFSEALNEYDLESQESSQAEEVPAAVVSNSSSSRAVYAACNRAAAKLELEMCRSCLRDCDEAIKMDPFCLRAHLLKGDRLKFQVSDRLKLSLHLSVQQIRSVLQYILTNILLLSFASRACRGLRLVGTFSPPPSSGTCPVLISEGNLYIRQVDAVFSLRCIHYNKRTAACVPDLSAVSRHVAEHTHHWCAHQFPQRPSTLSNQKVYNHITFQCIVHTILYKMPTAYNSWTQKYSPCW